MITQKGRCNPVGESPTVSVARVGHVVMPHLGAGNQPSYAWCKRPGRPEDLVLQRWVQPGGLTSVGDGVGDVHEIITSYLGGNNRQPTFFAEDDYRFYPRGDHRVTS
jgi:hypothetical protein